MQFEHLLYSAADRVATITLNRPDVRNALNWPMLEQLREALRIAEGDDDVRVIVLKGAGRHFSTGHDLGETMGRAPKQRDPRGWNQIVREEQHGISVWDARARMQGHVELDLEIWNCWKPVIAQVQGYCLGGAVGIALACDMLVASRDARMGYPPVRSIAPGEEISLFSWHVGLKRAKWLSLTGDSLTAREMLRFGIANWVFAADRLDEETNRIARRVANIDTELLSLSKTLVNRIFERQGLPETMRNSGELVALARQLACVRHFESQVERVGVRAAAEERDRPFGGIVGRYPEPEDDE